MNFAIFLFLALLAPATALTVPEGEKVAETLIGHFVKTLGNDLSMKVMADDLFATDIEYVWSGNQSGKGADTLVSDFDGSWGSMVDDFMPSNLNVVTDTGANTVNMFFNLYININGKKVRNILFSNMSYVRISNSMLCSSQAVDNCIIGASNVWKLWMTEDGKKIKRWEVRCSKLRY